MFRSSLLILVSCSTLFANTNSYSLQNSSGSQAHYFVKMGAFLESQNAFEVKSTFPTQVLKLEKYYSLVSEAYVSQEEAKKMLAQIKKQHKDAYIITLYKKEKKEVIRRAIKREHTPYEKGVTLYRSARYEEALATFDRVLIEDEEHVNAHIYYAKTLYKLGIYDEAKKEFNLLLKRPLESASKIHIQRYLAAIEDKVKRHFIRTTLSLGAGYDDNINLTTDDAQTQYGALTLENDTNKSTSTYGLATLGLSHKYKASAFDVITRFYSYNEFLHSAKGNDLNYIDLSTGLAQRFDKVAASVMFGANTSYLESRHIGYNFYTTPSVEYYHDKSFKTYLQATLLDNTSKYMDGKDYRLYAGTLGAQYRKARFASGVQVGAQFYKAKEDVRFDVDKDVLNASLFSRYFVTTKSFISANIAYAKDKYNVLDTTMGYKREDDMLSFSGSLGHKIGKKSLISLQVSRRENDSNINAYSYVKNTFTLKYQYQLRK